MVEKLHMSDNKFIKKRELPRHIFDSAKKTIDFSTVVITGYDTELNPIIELHGSGTLSLINNTYGILTAGHVWKYIYNSADVKYIVISVFGNNKWVYEDKNFFITHQPDKDIDICFIEVPIKILSRLKAIATFFPLTKCPLYKSIENNFLVLAGFPSENMPLDKSAFGIIYYFTDYIDRIEYSSWDEIHLLTDYKQNPNLIKSFKGVSGGAVWGFRIYHKDPLGKHRYYFKDIETYIAGVCYYQTIVKEGKGLIKAVGPKTIYGALYTDLLNEKSI